MQELLENPAAQAGVMPFLVALILAVALAPVRLGGLAVIAAFLLCVHFVSGLQLTPLTATRKVILLAVAAAAIGPLLDLLLKPTRTAVAVILVATLAGAYWAFWPVLSQRAAPEALLLAASAALALAVLVATGLLRLAGHGVRAGAAGLALGLGAGASAIVAGSLSYGLYGVALGAGAGGFLLPQMIRGTNAAAGATFTLPAMLAGGLVAVGAMLLAQLPWYSLLALAAVPLAVCLPGPRKAAPWLQAIVYSLYGFVVAGVACALAWPSSQT